jgi:hypothetical protein
VLEYSVNSDEIDIVYNDQIWEVKGRYERGTSGL